MAQIYDGRSENALRETLSRINWQLRGSTFYGQCSNDPLWRSIISSSPTGSFKYKCGQTEIIIEWTTSSDLLTDTKSILLELKLDDLVSSSKSFNFLSPLDMWLGRISWNLVGENMRATCSDDSLFRGVVPDAYPHENGIYPGEGIYIYQWDKVEKPIAWFKNNPIDSDDTYIALIMPMSKKSKKSDLLTTKDLNRYLEIFKRKIFKHNYHFNPRNLDRLLYEIYEEYQLNSRQAMQLYNYIIANYS